MNHSEQPVAAPNVTCGVVSSFRKDFLKFSFALKNEQKHFCISGLAYKKRSNQKSSVRESK